MATTAHTARNRPGASTRVTLAPDGTATVQCATHDIGNAAHHTTGRRLRELPITQDKVLAALSAPSSGGTS